MLVLNLEKAVKQIKQAKDVSEKEFPGLPDSVDADSFKKFYRIMCAVCPEDIEDISAEEILELWKNIPQYSKYFETGKTPCSEQIFMHAHSLTKRRVL